MKFRRQDGGNADLGDPIFFVRFPWQTRADHRFLVNLVDRRQPVSSGSGGLVLMKPVAKPLARCWSATLSMKQKSMEPGCHKHYNVCCRLEKASAIHTAPRIVGSMTVSFESERATEIQLFC